MLLCSGLRVERAPRLLSRPPASAPHTLVSCRAHPAHPPASCAHAPAFPLARVPVSLLPRAPAYASNPAPACLRRVTTQLPASRHRLPYLLQPFQPQYSAVYYDTLLPAAILIYCNTLHYVAIHFPAQLQPLSQYNCCIAIQLHNHLNP